MYVEHAALCLTLGALLHSKGAPWPQQPHGGGEAGAPERVL